MGSESAQRAHMRSVSSETSKARQEDTARQRGSGANATCEPRANDLHCQSRDQKQRARTADSHQVGQTHEVRDGGALAAAAVSDVLLIVERSKLEGASRRGRKPAVGAI